MDTHDGFEVQAMSDPDYEDLIVEVLYKGEFFLLVSQEDGLEEMRVSIQPRRDGQVWALKVQDLEAVLKKASSRLWELRRVSE